MEMCYDGALVMPRNYVLMDEEDMCYTEGGAALSWENVIKVGLGIMAVCGAVNQALTLFNNAIKTGATIKGISEAAFYSGVASKVSAAVGKITTWIGAHMGAVAAVLGALLGFTGGYALGSYVAKRVYARYGV